MLSLDMDGLKYSPILSLSQNRNSFNLTPFLNVISQGLSPLTHVDFSQPHPSVTSAKFLFFPPCLWPLEPSWLPAPM